MKWLWISKRVFNNKNAINVIDWKKKNISILHYHPEKFKKDIELFDAHFGDLSFISYITCMCMSNIHSRFGMALLQGVHLCLQRRCENRHASREKSMCQCKGTTPVNFKMITKSCPNSLIAFYLFVGHLFVGLFFLRKELDADGIKAMKRAFDSESCLLKCFNKQMILLTSCILHFAYTLFASL